MKKICFVLFFLLTFPAFVLAQQSLTIYAQENENSKVRGTITYADFVEELPIPKKKKKRNEIQEFIEFLKPISAVNLFLNIIIDTII